MDTLRILVSGKETAMVGKKTTARATRIITALCSTVFAVCTYISLIAASWAGSATTTVIVGKQSTLRINAVSVVTDCTWAPGTIVVQLGTTGGDGNPVTYSFGGTPTGDFVMSGSSIVVGANGIASANCGKPETLTINATQP